MSHWWDRAPRQRLLQTCTSEDKKKLKKIRPFLKQAKCLRKQSPALFIGREENPALNDVQLTTFDIQPSTPAHKLELGNVTQSQKENRPPPETQKTDAVVRPAGGARQTAVCQYVKYLKKNTNISRSIAEDVERNQKESLEKKIKISDNPLKGMSSRSGFAEKMGGLEDIVETAQTKAKREETEKYDGRLNGA